MHKSSTRTRIILRMVHFVHTLLYSNLYFIILIEQLKYNLLVLLVEAQQA